MVLVLQLKVVYRFPKVLQLIFVNSTYITCKSLEQQHVDTKSIKYLEAKKSINKMYFA